MVSLNNSKVMYLQIFKFKNNFYLMKIMIKLEQS